MVNQGEGLSELLNLWWLEKREYTGGFTSLSRFLNLAELCGSCCRGNVGREVTWITGHDDSMMVRVAAWRILLQQLVELGSPRRRHTP